ncbi:unnamed protein product [Pleuronectes platessa]|uniref:Uncharacterized protein n=1 Tax=Pleuronectes platessa TaxID=8262 RepID=A0A9N7UXS2_PLEPL|nr:unnamed protein product [Pleuronectes platessa]
MAITARLRQRERKLILQFRFYTLSRASPTLNKQLNDSSCSTVTVTCTRRRITVNMCSELIEGVFSLKYRNFLHEFKTGQSVLCYEVRLSEIPSGDIPARTPTQDPNPERTEEWCTCVGDDGNTWIPINLSLARLWASPPPISLSRANGKTPQNMRYQSSKFRVP